MDTYSHRVTEAVNRAMRESGVTVKALSDGTGIARATLIRRLAGSPFTTHELEQIATFLQVDVTVLAAAASAA